MQSVVPDTNRSPAPDLGSSPRAAAGQSDLERYLGATVSGRYQLESLIAEGGMGLVFRARHLVLDQPIALKLVRPSIAHEPAAVARFLDEARVIARVKSAHVARVFDSGRAEDGTPYMALELLNGWDLRCLLERDGPMPCEQAAEYVMQACHAIAEAHSLGVIHRDLKPENLFLHHGDDGSRTIKVIDFGISKHLNSELTSGGRSHTTVGETVGSPHYMSPEQMAAQDVDARADIWALGVVLFELVTGQVPFPGGSIGEVCAALFSGEAPALSEMLSDVPPSFERIVSRCLKKNLAERYWHANELAAALREFIDDPQCEVREGVTERPTALSMRAPEVAKAGVLHQPVRARRNWSSAWLGVCATALVVACLGATGSFSAKPSSATEAEAAAAPAEVIGEVTPKPPARAASGADFAPVQFQSNLRAPVVPEVVPVPVASVRVTAPPTPKKVWPLPSKPVVGARAPVAAPPTLTPPRADELIAPYPNVELHAELNGPKL